MQDRTEQLLRAARSARGLALRAATVVDSPANWLNGRRPYPPIWMRRQVGALRIFEVSAAQMTVTLHSEAGLGGDCRLLDVGCGCGALPLCLDIYGPWPGSYLGLDVDRRMIEWCNRHLARDRMKFAVHDYRSRVYNPSGRAYLPFAVESGWATVVVMKSVFTHLLPDDVSWYLRETARVLAPRGTAVITAVVYDEVTKAIRMRFPHDAGVFRYARRGSPESSLALSRDWLVGEIESMGLRVEYEIAPQQRAMYIRHV